jgi:hypothetical protein
MGRGLRLSWNIGCIDSAMGGRELFGLYSFGGLPRCH